MRRRRPAALLLVLGIGVALWLLHRDAPVQRTLVYDLGTTPGVTSVQVRYLEDGRLLRESLWRYPEDQAPQRVEHEVALPPRELDLRVRIAWRGGERVVERRFDAAAPGDPVIIRLD